MNTLSKATIVFCFSAVATANAEQIATEATPELPGRTLFEEHCSSCHERGLPGPPSRIKLRMMAPNVIYGALTRGAMRIQASRLSPEELQQITQYLTGSNPSDTEAPLVMCKNKTTWLDRDVSPVGSGWGITPDNARSISAQEAGLSAKELHNLKLLWSFTYPDSFRSQSQPTIVGNALFVGSSSGAVYAMNARSGCVQWTFQALAEIRGAVVYRRSVLKTDAGVVSEPTLFFADFLQVYAVDARTGSLRWKSKIEDDPIAIVGGTPLVSSDRLYVPMSGITEEDIASRSENYVCCTFRGSIAMLDRMTGALIWKRYAIPTIPTEQYENSLGKTSVGPSGAGIWSSPALDEKRGTIYFATGNNYSDVSDDNSDAVFSIDARTGEVKWKTQTTRNDTFNGGCIGRHIATCPKKVGPDIDFTAPPILVHGKREKDIVVAGQKSGEVFGLDPDSGAIRWRKRISQDPNPLAGSLWFGMAVQDGRVIIPTVSMRPNDSPHPQSFLISPLNGLYALSPFTGRLLWSAPVSRYCEKAAPCGGVQMALLAIPGAVFAGSVDGYIRAYDTHSGSVLWRFNTAQRFTDQSGAQGSGGSVSGAGQVMVANGMLYVNSYDPRGGHSAVLLAFGIKNIR